MFVAMPALARRVRGLLLLIMLMGSVLAGLLPAMAQAQGQGQGGVVTLFGPVGAQLGAAGGRQDFFADIQLYSRDPKQGGPYRIVVDNASAALAPGRDVQIEIFHNLRKVVTSADLFSATGQPVAQVSRPVEVRPFVNLVIVKITGRSPVNLSWRIVAGHEPVVPELKAIAPNPLNLVNGSAGVFNLTLAPPPAVAGQISVSSSAPAVASVAATVPYAAGQSRVSVPVQAVGVGSASVRAQLGESSVSGTVQVNPAPPRITGLQPVQAQLREGASGEFSVSISPAQLQPVTVSLASSDAAKLAVPPEVVIAPGQSSAGFQAQALAVGQAQISASIAGGSQAPSQAFSQVQVVPQPPTVVSLLPATSVLHQGSSAELTVALSAAQSTPARVALASADASVASVPAEAVVPAGATQASFAVQGQGVGNTLIAATLGASSVQAAVQVTPAPAAITDLAPANASVTQGAQTELVLTLNAAQSTATTIALATQPSGIVQVPGELVIPAGQTQGRITVTALAAGQADVVVSLGGASRASAITVTPQPVALDSLLPNPLGLQTGASGGLTVRLRAAQAQPVVVALVGSAPDRLQVPPSVTIPAGQIEQGFAVQALAAGQATVTATATSTSGSTSVQTLVQIAEPPPRIASLLPATQDLPKGKLGTLRLTLDRAAPEAVTVALSNGAPTVLGVPASATVPAGQLAADIPVTAQTQGSATITASLSLGGTTTTAQGVVRVVDPEVTGIQITPNPVHVSAGQSTELRAMATYSDGSERDISNDAATAWSTLDASVASVSAQGRLSGVQAGGTTVQALQAVLPTHGHPSPSPIVGQAEVIVGAGDPLALSTGTSHLQVGQSAVVSITSPYAAGANPIAIQLHASGTGALEHPASASIGAGLSSVNITVRAVRAGAVQLHASASQFAPGSLGFTITEAPISLVQVSAVTPESAAPGASVTLSGIGFASPASANTVSFAGGAPAQVVSGNGTEMVVQVPEQAQSGPITVTNANGSGQSPEFTVEREQDFGFTASPANLRVMQGSSAVATLQLQSSGSQPFEGLARLSISGLPEGVSAEFDPPQLSAVQSGKLVLKAASGAPLQSAALTIRSEATINGLPWVRQSLLSVQVVSRVGAGGVPVTGVKGRFVTPEGRPVPGVIVRQDSTTNQVTADAAGNFFIEGLPAGTTTLRFDATPAHPLYPIWPMNVVLQAGELRTYEDWVINPPPADEKFKPISNATAEQRISDERYPGFEVVLPAGASITGWDGVRKTRIAVERIMPDQLPVEQPPFVMKEAYQLYFGTPMGGIPSEPIPVTLPNVAERDPGDEVEIWWFDGSPMGGSGEWKLAGMGTVSDDGKTVSSNPGVGLPRFCGVCGLVSLNCDPPPLPPEPPPVCPPPSRGKPIDLLTGQELLSTEGMSCSGSTPIELGWRYNPVDSFQNRAYTRGSFGMGWTNAYDIVFLPFSGGQKRMVMPGGRRVNFTGADSGDLSTSHPLFQGVVARRLGGEGSGTELSVPLGQRIRSTFSSSSGGGSSGGGSRASVSLSSRPPVSGGSTWEVLFKDGTRWIFEPFSGLAALEVTQFERGGPPSWLTRVIDRNGNVTRITRNATGKITRIEGAGGREFNLELDEADHVSRITDHTGRTTRIEYTEDHRISRMTDPEGRETSYSYHGLPLYVGPRGISSYKGGSSGVVTSSSSSGSGGGSGGSSQSQSAPQVACGDYIPWIKTPKGGTSPILPAPRRYPLFSGLKEIHEPGFAQPTVNTYSTDRVIRQVSASGEVRSFSYRRTGACVAKVASDAQVYESEEQVPTSTGLSMQGLTCKAGTPYEVPSSCSSGLCPPVEQGMCPEVESEQTHAAGWRFYGGSNTETIVVEPNGARISYRFDAQGLPVEYVDEAGQSTKYEYDGQRRLSKVTDALGRETRTQYDGWGNLLSHQGPLGRRVDYAYHPDHLQVTQTTHYLMGMGSESGGGSYSYTPITRSYNFDERGNIRSARMPWGGTTTWAYDDAGQRISQTSPVQVGAGSVPVIADANASSIAATARRIQYEYTSAGDLAAVSNALGERYSLQSDALGRVSGVTDPLSYSSGQQYNRTSQPTVTTDALGQQSRLDYDSAGRLRAVVNAAGVTIESYGYDSHGRLTRVTDALGRSTTIEYNGAGQVSAVTDRKGQRTSLAYDERGRVITLGLPDRTITRSFDVLGRVSEMRDNASAFAWRYDEAGRIVQFDTSTAAGSHRLAYEYDSLDRVTKRTLSGAGIQHPEATTYEWDTSNRITRHSSRIGPESGGTEHHSAYSYDVAGRLQSRTSRIGSEPELTQRYHYDEVDRLSRIEYLHNAGQASEQLIERIDYGYDDRGQIVQKTTLNNHGVGTGDTPMEATYDAANRMLSITLRPSEDTATHKTYQLGYDANGNLIEKTNAANSAERTVYTWDSQNRLMGITRTEEGQSTTASYSYDLYGRRIQSTVQQGSSPAQTVQYVYDGAQLLGEMRSGRMSHRLITGLSLDENIARLAMTPAGAVELAQSRQMLGDAINSTLAQLNAQDGSVATGYGYSPYGETTAIGPDASQNPNQYTGRESDDATGLYFYRARYYDPVLKRFISEDPIGLAGGANVYAYVNGDPVSLSDPTGLVYRKGNGYSDIPPPGPGCQKAVWLGGYIMGWKPCDPPNKPPVCPADGPQPPISPNGGSGSGGPSGGAPGNGGPSGGAPGNGGPSGGAPGNGGPTGGGPGNGGPGTGGPGSDGPNYGVGVGGSLGGFGPLGCTASGSLQNSGASGYVGCGVGVGGWGVLGGGQGSIGFGDPTGKGVNVGAGGGLFGAGAIDIFITSTGVNIDFTWGYGGGFGAGISGGVRGVR